MEVERLYATHSEEIISKLKDIFARHGIPETFVSDNGPQYTSEQFRKFAKGWNFKHITSSPHYPQSNGKAENAVKTVKNILRKCVESGDDFRLALLEWRNMTTEGLSSSPV